MLWLGPGPGRLVTRLWVALKSNHAPRAKKQRTRITGYCTLSYTTNQYLYQIGLNKRHFTTYLYSLAWPDRFFPFFFVVAEKGSGIYTIVSRFVQRIARFWRLLIGH